MINMPRAAKFYWAIVVLIGVAITVAVPFWPLPASKHAAWEVAMFGIAALAFGGQKLKVNLHGNDAAMSMTLGFAVTFATILRLGPAIAVPIAVLGSLSSCVYPKRQKYHQLIFNVCLAAIEALVGGLVFVWLNGWNLQLEPVRAFFALSVGSFSFFLVNTLGVAQMISLYSGEKLLSVWKENFLWTAPSYLASACIGALAIMLFKSNSVALLLFVLPMASVVYHWFSTYTAHVAEKQQHIEELRAKQAELAQLYLATIESLALAIDAKDQYTHQHIVRVQRYSVAIAQAMGLEGDQLQGVRTGALLHDIGKLGVPEYILLKPGALTNDEFDKIKKHPEIGAAILDPVVFPWPVLDAVKYHHERWDGSGYPEGLRAEGIPLIARIMAVADVYDAVTSTRAYRGARTHEQAIEIISKDSGRLFDKQVVTAFLSVIDGVIQEMANEGTGPLVSAALARSDDSKAGDAARDISRMSVELWALYEVAQSLSIGYGRKQTCELLVTKIHEIYNDATVALMLWDPESRTLTTEAASGEFAPELLEARSAGESSQSAHALASRTTYRGPFDPGDLILTRNGSPIWNEPSASMIVPVVYDGHPIGTINVYHRQPDVLSDNDAQLLRLVGERAGAALWSSSRLTASAPSS